MSFAAAPEPDGWTRPRPSGAGLLRDALLSVGLAVLAVISEYLRSRAYPAEVEAQPIGELVAYAAIGVLPLVARRRLPIVVMLVVAAGFFVTGLRAPQVALSPVFQVSMFMAIFAANAWTPRRGWLRVACYLVFGFMFGWVGVLLFEARDDVPAGSGGLITPLLANVVVVLGINVVYFFGATVWGRTAWRNARQTAELERTAAALRRSQDANARQAVLEDRLRIARELHDVVAHHVSSIGVQAAGARRVLSVDPAETATALTSIEASSREAVAEMRQLLGTLRASEELQQAGDSCAEQARTPQPGLDDLEALCEQAGQAGLRVRLRTVGDPRPVPTTMANSLYRIVQESLTNIRRHSTAAEARLTLRYTPNAVEVEVIDDGSASNAPTGGGLGHVGIRERVALHGGEIELGPRVVGGYRVRCRLPLDAAPEDRLGADGAGSGADSGAGDTEAGLGEDKVAEDIPKGPQHVGG